MLVNISLLRCTSEYMFEKTGLNYHTQHKMLMVPCCFLTFHDDMIEAVPGEISSHNEDRNPFNALKVNLWLFTCVMPYTKMVS